MSEQMKLEQVVDEALKTLTDRERYVLEQRCGYHGDPATQRSIGQKYGVSSARIGQVELHALQKLRHPYQSKKLLPYLYQALVGGNDNFYARFFIKVFDLSKENIKHIIESGPPEPQEPTPEGPISYADSIETLQLSIRTFNSLFRARVHTIQDLVNLSEEDLGKIKGLGVKALEEIREKLSNLNMESADA